MLSAPPGPGLPAPRVRRARHRHLLSLGLVLAAALATIGGSACGDDSGDADAFCATAARLEDADVLDPNVTQEEVVRTSERFRRLASRAPAEIDDDVELLSDAFDRLAEGDVSFLVDPEEAARVSAAAEAFTDYVRDRC